jgi:uncharacterized protein
MGNPVVHFEVLGQDGDKLRSFYGDLFGWQYNLMEGMDYGTLQRGDGEPGIGGGIGEAPQGPGHTTFYVYVDDVQAALDQAESLGGSKVMGPMDIPGDGSIGLFTDPEGHTVGVWHGDMNP